MITCKIGENIVNCFDGKYDRDTLKKWSKKGILKCPVCGEQYTYNHGTIKIPYFKHLNSECSLYGEPETDEHKEGKNDLYNWILKQDNVTDVILEGWIPETKQRPDIMFKYNGEQFVIEYQCSPIVDEYIERHDLYEAANIKDIWILGTDNYIEKEEIGIKRRGRYIESKSLFHYDSKFKIMLLSDIDHYNLNSSTLWNISNFKVNSSLNGYGSINYKSVNSRKWCYENFIKKGILIADQTYWLFDINKIIFDKEKYFVVNPVYISKTIDYYDQVYKKINIVKEQKEFIESYLKIVMAHFRYKYNMTFEFMPSQSSVFGFKYNGNYFGLGDLDNYPNMSLLRIKYEYKGFATTFNKIGDINVESNDKKDIIQILEEKLSKQIEFILEKHKIEEKIEKMRKEKYESLMLKLSRFTNNPIYLLFKEDNNQIPKNIRFKFFNGMSDDVLITMEQLYNDLKFLEKKQASYYTFMIPRKRIRISSTGMSKYKVNNHQCDVAEIFESFGFKIFSYKELIRGTTYDK